MQQHSRELRWIQYPNNELPRTPYSNSGGDYIPGGSQGGSQPLQQQRGVTFSSSLSADLTWISSSNFTWPSTNSDWQRCQYNHYTIQNRLYITQSPHRNSQDQGHCIRVRDFWDVWHFIHFYKWHWRNPDLNFAPVPHLAILPQTDWHWDAHTWGWVQCFSSEPNPYSTW